VAALRRDRRSFVASLIRGDTPIDWAVTEHNRLIGSHCLRDAVSPYLLHTALNGYALTDWTHHMSDKQVVLAIFKDEAAADAAVASLKTWDKATDDIKANAIGVLVLDKNGKLKTHKLGKRSTGKGAGIGIALAVIAPASLVAGAIGGGVLGALHHKGLGLDDDERDQIAAQLTDGKAAVGVLAEDVEASDISAKLTELGGSTKVHTLSKEAVAEIDKAAPAVEAAEAAAPAAPETT
jgi:uncharacterized membrane protein